MDKVAALAEFHGAFNLTGSREDLNTRVLRMKLLQEEFDEYIAAEKIGDDIEVLDALTDMLYIIYGTADLYDFDLEEAFKRVHESNMSKLGEDGKPIVNDGVLDPSRPKGKVLKGPNFSPPDLSDLI